MPLNAKTLDRSPACDAETTFRKTTDGKLMEKQSVSELPARSRALSLRRPAQVWSVVHEQEDFSLPLECANCAANAGHAVRCATRTRNVLVPYCARCLRSLEREKTQLAVAVSASLFIGLTLLLVLPWTGLGLRLPGYLGWSLVGVLLPLVWVALVSSGTAAGQTTSGSAVWWEGDTLVGTNQAWMEQLAALNETRVTSKTGKRPILGWPFAVIPLTIAAIAPAAYATFFPTVVVLNLSPHDLELLVDGRPAQRVPVSSLESSDAAVRLPLPAGTHWFEARTVAESAAVARVQVTLDAGALYLFAPGAANHCFWLERDTYGKASEAPIIRRLGGKDGFFSIPTRIDSWFSPNPDPGADTRSSGGDMVALRHARCPDAPQ